MRFSKNARRFEKLPVTQNIPESSSKKECKESTMSKELVLMESVSDQVKAAELLWSLKVAQCDYSFRSCDDTPSIFRRMFPCTVSENFTYGRSKASYMMSDCLGPCLLKAIRDGLCSGDSAFTLMIDETTTAQVRNQMDTLARYWCEKKEKDVTKYLTSFLFGHAQAVDLKKVILDMLKDGDLQLPLRRFFNISLGGTNINKSLWKQLDDELKSMG